VTAWQPLLEGVWKERALEAVGAIADRLGALPALDSGPADRAALAEGYPGLAVLFGYLAKAWPAKGYDATARRFLEEATTAASQAPLPASLYTGLAGVGWAAEHLRQQLPPIVAEQINAEVDEALREHLNTPCWTGDYDLIFGLVGLGVYALERLSAPPARGILERVVAHLAATAERRPEGATWWTNPAWLPAPNREWSPHGYYNLGLAHGVPGVIALLAAACAVGVGLGSAWPLLDDAVRWLLAQQELDGAGFGGWVEPEGQRIGSTRFAWCYGDPGVAAALLLAARCVGEPAWESEALAVAVRAAARTPDRTAVQDACLCHGAAGLGHLFNRMYQASGESRLAEAAQFWFRRAIEIRHPQRGIAGFATYRPDRDGDQPWENDPGLLTGAAGIALSLLAACTPVEPAWDDMLLVSIPSKQSALGAR
jgi:lantibiotic modifying enzyme